ncbi:MAG: polysaccharide deacetylase family protein [Bacteroidetes bacterium]|nr:polysaccharide deacetylase family protein [Bacteroidota bacterium]
MSAPFIIYSANDSPRLRYVLDWIFKERFQSDYIITPSEADVLHLPFFISYGKQLPNSYYVPDAGLLWQTEIMEHDIKTGEWKNIPTLYASDDSSNSISFDVFSAVFFLLSRYEEYYSDKTDKHGRYPATESILYKNGWLERPIVDEWVAALAEELNASLPVFSYLPTYDIDIAWSYKHKGFARNAGGLLKDLLSLKFDLAAERVGVLNSKLQDPFDCFEWLQSVHKANKYKPAYFLLSALETGPFDKNISPEHPAMRALIKQLDDEGAVGIHPSYDTYKDEAAFQLEKATLEKIIQKKILLSRQHYVRMFLPYTYQQLLSLEITDDYSMGYGTHIGFRNGSGFSSLWYDITNETVTSLKVHPFCFMDSTAHYEMKLGAEDAFTRLAKMTAILRKTNSSLITVFHNFSLGTANEWKGWRNNYESFLREVSK